MTEYHVPSCTSDLRVVAKDRPHAWSQTGASPAAAPVANNRGWRLAILMCASLISACVGESRTARDAAEPGASPLSDRTTPAGGRASALAGALSNGSVAGATESASFAWVLRKAGAYQPEVRAALSRVAEAETRVLAVRAERLPSATYGISADGRTGDEQLNVGLKQLVYDHGATKAQMNAAHAETERQTQLFWRAVEKAMGQAAGDYISVAQAVETTAAARDYLARAIDLQKRIESRVEAGVADSRMRFRPRSRSTGRKARLIRLQRANRRPGSRF